jgi:hypothetical protein
MLSIGIYLLLKGYVFHLFKHLTYLFLSYDTWCSSWRKIWKIHGFASVLHHVTHLKQNIFEINTPSAPHWMNIYFEDAPFWGQYHILKILSYSV